MKIKVTRNDLIITEDKTPNSGSYKENNIEFELASDYDGLVNKAIFYSVEDKTHSYLMNITNNVCDYPAEVLQEQGTYILGVYGFEVENEELKLRLSPKPTKICIKEGSYKEGTEEGSIITPTQFEQYCAEMERLASEIESSLQGIDNIDIDSQKVGKIATITITKKDGTTESFELEDGTGIDYNWLGTSLGIKREDEINYTYVDLKGDKGDAGAIKMLIVNQLPATGEGDTIYLVPIQGETGNNYEEYIYVNNAWEKLGGIQVEVDLSDYYTKQETNTLLDGKADTSDIPDLTDYVKNTDYPTSNKYGVIKLNATYGYTGTQAGSLQAMVYDYNTYLGKFDQTFIGKGTLENVITGKQLVNQTYVDNLVGDIDSVLDAINGEVVS